MKIHNFLAAMYLASTPLFAGGTVVARQGTAADVTPEDFRSPMVLDLPLGVIAHLKPSNGKRFADVTKFVCDDASFRSLLFSRVSDAPGKDGAARFRITGSVYVRPSHDRLVRLQFAIHNGTRMVGKTATAELNVEERESVPFVADLSIPRGELEALSEEGTTASLQVVFSVSDNR